MSLLKAKNPINSGRFGPRMPLIYKSHFRLAIETLQKDDTKSRLTINVIEDPSDVISLDIIVDGKHHNIDIGLCELLEAINKVI